MQQFDHDYLLIVNSLRIMGDALVLLNPKKPTLGVGLGVGVGVGVEDGTQGTMSPNPNDVKSGAPGQILTIEGSIETMGRSLPKQIHGRDNFS